MRRKPRECTVAFHARFDGATVAGFDCERCGTYMLDEKKVELPEYNPLMVYHCQRCNRWNGTNVLVEGVRGLSVIQQLDVCEGDRSFGE